MTQPFTITPYGILKTFISGETIKLAIDGQDCEYTFIRVSPTHVFLKSTDGNQEEIHLDRITKITL